ncbi:hypothetical protein yc1106_04799 [Curvularia clavata]|uniref:Uncharacterized protein n=1 Tax=Curvularia clavata TaxID=95742 RepID=A0A9Q8Z9B0_CURCL|nr:hypothetical protein yc1106_04799 [Curvularia clavata]
MKPSTYLLTLFALGATTLATDTSMPMSTLTIHPGCPSAAPADAMVTRSAVAVPSCAAGNATKPMIVSMSGDMTMTMTGGGPMMTPSAIMSGNPAEFTGGATRKGVVGGLGVLGGLVVALVV